MLALKHPLPTTDILIRYMGGIVLILRKNPPHGWAIPGGFVDYGESLEAAASIKTLFQRISYLTTVIFLKIIFQGGIK